MSAPNTIGAGLPGDAVPATATADANDWARLLSPPKTEYSADELLDLAKEPDWIIDNMLATGSMVIVAGPPKKAKKTFLAMRAALAVARGEEFLGKPTKRLPAYYVFLEDGLGRAGLRLQRLGYQRGEGITFVGIFSVAGLDALLARLGARGEPALIIVDPLVTLESVRGVVDENNGPAMEGLLRPLREFAQATGSGILVIHHARKDGDEIRGSTAIKGSSDGWWFLKPREDCTGVSILLTLRDGADDEVPVTIEFPPDDVEDDERPITFTVSGDVSSPDHLERVRSVFRALSPAERLSQNKVAKAASLTREQVKDPLKTLEALREVHRPAGPRKGYARGPNLAPIDQPPVANW